MTETEAAELVTEITLDGMFLEGEVKEIVLRPPAFQQFRHALDLCNRTYSISTEPNPAIAFGFTFQVRCFAMR